MKLEKLIITITKKKNKFETLTVQFNPTEYSVDGGSTWQEQKKPTYISELQYTGWQRRTLSMELFFDTYETKADVREQTNKLYALLVPEEKQSKKGRKKIPGKRPPTVKLSWGGADHPKYGIFSSTWVLEKLSQKFTLFSSAGVPVRATANVTFKEFEPPKQKRKKHPKASSLPDQIYTLSAGDTLSGIAEDLLEDPARWRIIAERNNIDNPRLPEVGQTLIIPAIK